MCHKSMILEELDGLRFQPFITNHRTALLLIVARLRKHIIAIDRHSLMQLGKTLAWCAVVQLVLFLLCSLFRFLWVKYSTETHERWLHNYIGHEDEPPHRPFLDMTFRWIQFGMSITTVVLWIYKTYAWRVGVADNIIELTMWVSCAETPPTSINQGSTRVH
jgi:hypothetical protein